MQYKLQNTYTSIFLTVTLYISLVLGFYFDENLSYGAVGDWLYTDLPVIKDLSVDVKTTLLNYENYGHRHSPIYLIFLSFFKKIGFSFDVIRFIHLNISILLIYLFFKCLSLKFKNVDKNILLILSLSIFLSPTFRSLSIWPSSRLIGLIFFLFSIYEYLKYQNNRKIRHIWMNIFYLIFSSYISPNFSLFIFYFFYKYFNKISLSYIFILIIFCAFLSLPALYYLFYLDINFLTAETPGINSNVSIGLDFNFSNKILIISSIIFFHLIPFLLDKKIFFQLINFIKKNFIILVLFTIINIIYFNYLLNFTGGGFFFQISNYLFSNNYIFYFSSFFSIGLIWYLSKNSINNFLIFFLLIVSNIQNTIYHKYYDPLIMILFFTIISQTISDNFLKSKINLLYLYIFFIIYILMRVIKNYIFLNL